MLKYLVPSYWEYINGVYYEKDKHIITEFSEKQQDSLFVIEDTSWWFQYRATLLLKILDLYGDKKTELVDIGAGNGYNSLRAQMHGYLVTVMEPSQSACFNAKKRGIMQIACGGVNDNSILNDSIPQFMLCDVLEHMDDDRGFAKLLFKKSLPGARGVVTVPAFMQLWSSEDESAGHFRRYKIEQIAEVFESAGFEVISSNYFMSFLYLPILIVRVWMERLGLIKKTENRNIEEKNKIKDKQFRQRKGIVGFFLAWFESRELNKITSSYRIRRGSSVYLVVRKPTHIKAIE